MSRIPADRPIPTREPVLATQQTSETESVEKTDVQGKAILDAEQSVKPQKPQQDPTAAAKAAKGSERQATEKKKPK